MSSDDFEYPRRRLSQWRVDPPTDPALAAKVLRRMQQESPSWAREAPLAFWLKQRWQHRAYAGALALILVLTGVLLTVLTARFAETAPPLIPPKEYRFAIDPLYRLVESTAPAAKVTERTVDESLEWLRDELELTDGQFHKLASLHAEFTPIFENMFRDLQSHEAVVQNFESMRRKSQLIDFIQVYRVAEDFQHLQDRASTSTAELVDRVSQIVDDRQRSRYLELLKIEPDHSPHPDESASTRVKA